jgi:outer membrane protein TolC
MRAQKRRAGRRRLLRFALLAGIILGAPGGAPAAGGGPAEEPRSPLEALRQVVRQAWHGPSLQAVQAGFAAEEAASRLQANPGSPYTTLEIEGIEGSLDRAPHAGNYLRFGLPFNGPGQGKRSQSLVEGTRLLAASATRVAALELGARAATDWLDLAGTVDRLAVRRAQLARLEEAVALQRRRVELGELAGAAVVPLELERARQVSLVYQLEAEQSYLAAAIEELTGGPFPLPAEGDLARLRAEIGPWIRAPETLDERVAASPALQRSAHDIERTRLDGEQRKAVVRGRPTFELSWENFPSLYGLEGYDSLGFALNVPLPLGKLGRHQEAETQARVRQGEAEAEALRRHLRARVQRWARLAEAAARSLEALEGLERELPRTGHVLEEQFRLGAIDYLVYLDGLTRSDEIRIRNIQARRAELHARVALAGLLSDPSYFPLPDPAQETLP